MPTVTLSDAKARLARLLAEVEELGDRFVITRSGKPTGVLVSVEEYEGLLETLEILSDPSLAEAVREGLEDVEAGRVLSHDEVWSDVDAPVHR